MFPVSTLLALLLQRQVCLTNYVTFFYSSPEHRVSMETFAKNRSLLGYTERAIKVIHSTFTNDAHYYVTTNCLYI